MRTRDTLRCALQEVEASAPTQGSVCEGLSPLKLQGLSAEALFRSCLGMVQVREYRSASPHASLPLTTLARTLHV
jgi:hypothetical protein